MIVCSCGGWCKSKVNNPNIGDYRVDCKDAMIEQKRTDTKADLLRRLDRKEDIPLLGIKYYECMACGRVSETTA